MISMALRDLVQCPECGTPLSTGSGVLVCGACGRTFDATGDYLDLRPKAARELERAWCGGGLWREGYITVGAVVLKGHAALAAMAM